MKVLIAVMAAVLVSGTCLAAQGPTSTHTPKGVHNAKKVMQHNKERYQKVKEVKKRARLRKHQAQTTQP